MATKLKRYSNFLKVPACVLLLVLSLSFVYGIFYFDYLFDKSQENAGGGLAWLSLSDLVKSDYLSTSSAQSTKSIVDDYMIRAFNAVTEDREVEFEKKKREMFSTDYDLIRFKYRDEKLENLNDAELLSFFKDNYADKVNEVEAELINAWREAGFITNERNGTYELIRNSVSFQHELDMKINELLTEMKSEVTARYANIVYNNTNDEVLYEFFEVCRADEIAALDETLRNERAARLNDALSFIEGFDGIYYVIKAGNTIYGNRVHDVAFITAISGVYSELSDKNAYYAFGFTNDFYTDMQIELLRLQAVLNRLIFSAAVWFALFLTCFSYLIYASGRKSACDGEKKTIYMMPFDRIFTEFTIILAAGISVPVAYIFRLLYDCFGENTIPVYALYAALTLLIAFFWLTFFVLVRNIKNKTFIKNSIVFIILKYTALTAIRLRRKTKEIICTLYSKGNPMSKTVFTLTAFGVLTMVPFLGFITLPLAIVFMHRQVRDYKKLTAGVAAIKNGVYDEKIEIYGTELAKLGNDINMIASGLGDEVMRRTKSERLKTELIVNVSHDIRTPLTSLITYTDLLKKEKSENEEINRYVEIIAQKADRLKTLTDDLFESAKAASGNVSVNTERVDINSLIIQAYGEFDEKIKASSLEFITTMPEEKLYANADGRLLWRVLQNLLSNTLSYSLENSRVYVDARAEDGRAVIEIKNISKTPLNIPEDEITERFKRGDAARSSEGSGLGLDIARSLILCQNGELSIRIDGDLFKARISLELYSI